MNESLYRAVMRCAIDKCIGQGEYYDETEDGNVGFEISEDGRIFLNHVSELAKELSGWLYEDADIMDLIKELDES